MFGCTSPPSGLKIRESDPNRVVTRLLFGFHDTGIH